MLDYVRLNFWISLYINPITIRVVDLPFSFSDTSFDVDSYGNDDNDDGGDKRCNDVDLDEGGTNEGTMERWRCEDLLTLIDQSIIR